MPSRPKRATYITQLKVKNARSFGGEQILALSNANGCPSRWTLILGENGVGKTTLLECLAQSTPYANTNDPDGTEHPSFFLEPLGYVDQQALERLSRHGDVDFELSASYAVEAVLDGVARTRGVNFEIGVTFERRQGEVREVNLRTCDKGNIEEPLVLSYGAGRRMGVGNLESSTDPTNPSVFSDSAMQLVDAEELIQQLDYAALRRSTKTAARQRDVFLDMIASLLPDVGARSNITIYGPSPVGRTSKTGVHVKTPYGEVPLRQLSYGYQTMAAWLADIGWRLFRQYPHSVNPLLEPAIVLVDEIDLHLHPRWQRELRRHLTRHFPAVQFIATAHSPSMAQANMDENLAVVRRVEDAAYIENEPNVVLGWRIDQVVTSDLFGLETPWPPAIEELLDEQARLVATPKRSAGQERRLREVEAQVLALEPPEPPEITRAMAVIRRAAAALGNDHATTA